MKFKEGQKVRVVSQKHGHLFDLGDIVTIKFAYPSSNRGKGGYSCELNGKIWWLTDEELEEID